MNYLIAMVVGIMHGMLWGDMEKALPAAALVLCSLYLQDIYDLLKEKL